MDFATLFRKADPYAATRAVASLPVAAPSKDRP